MLKLAGAAGAGLVGGGLGTVGATPAAGAVAASSSVLDDFEDGDLSEYSGNTGSFTVQSATTLEGSYTLKGTSANVRITADALSTPRGYEYTLRTMIGTGSAGKADFYVCGQATGLAAFNNCYYVRADAPNDTLFLVRRDSGANTILDSVNVTVDEGTEYRLAIELAAGTVRGRLVDSSGTEIAATAAVSDSTYTDGTLGYNVGNGAPIYVDYVTEEQMGETTVVLEDFEDGDISEYSGNTGKFNVQSATTLKGAYTLEGTSAYGRIATDRISTPRGYEYRCRITTGNGSGAAPCLIVCSQYPDYPLDSCYFVRADTANDKLDLVRAEGGTDTQLTKVDLSVKENTEYILSLSVGLDTLTARLLDAGGSQLAETEQITDNMYQDGVLGFYTGGGSPTYYDHVKKVPIGQIIGRFETNLNGWTTNGNHQLSRKSESNEPCGVTQGNYCLDVQTGTAVPQVENTKCFKQADCGSSSFLVADFVGYCENSKADLHVKFKYHRSDGGSTEESPIVQLPQWVPGHATWDLTELPNSALENPERIEVIWYPSDHPPGSSFDYTGQFWIDNVRLTRSADAISSPAMKTKMATYKRRFGQMAETVVTNKTDTVEEGKFVYSDGTEKTYRYEKLTNNKAELTIDGEVFKRGGGW